MRLDTSLITSLLLASVRSLNQQIRTYTYLPWESPQRSDNGPWLSAIFRAQ